MSDSIQLRSSPLVERQFGLPDCWTTCLTQQILAGQCVGLVVDYSCFCTNATFKKNNGDCLKNTCNGDAAVKSAQSMWDEFCVYVNNGALGGLPTSIGSGGGLNIPTSIFNTGTATKSLPTSVPSGGGGSNNNNNGGSGNSSNSNGGGDSKESGPPLGAIIGGAIGGVALILIGVFIILYFRRRRPAQPIPQHPQPTQAMFPPQQMPPPQPPNMSQMGMGPPSVMNPSMTGAASMNPSFNSSTPFANQSQNYAPSANSFISGQSYNNIQPGQLPPGAGMGYPTPPQGAIYPEPTGSSVGSPFLSPTSASSHAHNYNTRPTMPPGTASSSVSIPTSDQSRLTMFSTNSQQHLLGVTSYSNSIATTPSPPSTGSSPSQQLSEKQRLQVHLEYQDGGAIAGSSSSSTGPLAGSPSGFHVTNAHQQDGLDGRSVVYTSTETSGQSQKGGRYTVTNPHADGAGDSVPPPLYSEQSP